jgi:hypothetical protein
MKIFVKHYNCKVIYGIMLRFSFGVALTGARWAATFLFSALSKLDRC